MTIAFPGETADYRAAREALLRQEIALRRLMESVAAQRRALPPGGPVPQDYVFDGLGADGAPAKIRLSQLFAPGRDALFVYSFMFPRHPGDDRAAPEKGATAKPRPEEGPCPSCTARLDYLDRVAEQVEAQGVNFVVVARTTLDRLLAFARERGWKRLRLLSSAGNSFNRDYHAEADGEQMPMLTVFRKDGGTVRHFWSSELFYVDVDAEGQGSRHMGTIDVLWNILDFTPGGRPDAEEQMQYPTVDAVPAHVS